jgi:gliding motility-associated-like protein
VLHYVITVTNNGNVTISNLEVNDPLTGLSETITNLAVGGSQTFYTNYTVTQADIDNGTIINIVKVEGEAPNGEDVEAEDSASSNLDSHEIIANNDDFSAIDLSCDLGGLAGNVLDNDLLNGNPVNSDDVSITIINDGGISGLVINPDGSLIVPGGLALGDYTITYQICEVLNPANCDQADVSFTITDNIAPTITCPDDISVNTDLGSCFATDLDLDYPLTDDNCQVVSIVNDAPESFPIGETTVTWTVTDHAGNSTSCEQIVTVIDNEPPTITCPPDITVNNDPAECSAIITDIGWPATDDNCQVESIINDALASYPVGTTTVTWTVTDESGNQTSCEQLITVIDNEAPTITCPPNFTFTADLGQNYASELSIGYPVTDDNCQVESIENDAPAVYPIGETTVTWTVTDASGNTAYCEQIITVIDEEPPTITCPEDIIVNNDAGECFAIVSDIGHPLTSDNDAVASIVNDALANYPVGTTTVTWTVTDASGNQTSCEQLITVIDNEAPTIICPADITSCLPSVSLPYPEVADNCGIESVINNAPAEFTIGETTTVTWTVTDIHGNSSTCDQLVTISSLELANLEVENLSCYGLSDGSITLEITGGTGEFTYTLSDGSSQNSNVFENLAAGTYTIIAEDENACSIEIEVEITSPDELSLSHSPTCHEGEVGIVLNANGGTTPYQYSIDGGLTYQNESSFGNITGEGNLELIVMDANGCTSQALTITISSLNTLSASIEVLSANSCYGENDAEVEILIEGGQAPYTYTINDNTVTNDNIIRNLAAGEYTVSIRDNNGCPASANFVIDSAIEIEIDLVSVINDNCNYSGEGEIEVEVEGGSSPYIYTWSNGANQEINSGLNAGNYTLTVTDILGCEKTIDIELTAENLDYLPEAYNVFTPNNDGQNDYFVFKNLDKFPENELVIYNRWGNEVYTQENYDNSWDGSNLSEGTYFWMMKVKVCGEYEKIKGYVTILR